MAAFEVAADGSLLAALTQAQARAGNLSAPLARVGAALVGRIRQGFAAGVDPWGRPWQPLRPSTLAARRRAGIAGTRPLVATGTLRDSVAARHDARSVTVETGPGVEYATTQQFGAAEGAFGAMANGSPIPWGTIPARPFFPVRGDRVDLPAPWRADIATALADHILPAGRP